MIHQKAESYSMQGETLKVYACVRFQMGVNFGLPNSEIGIVQ